MVSFTLFATMLVAGVLEIFVPVLLGLMLWKRLKTRWVYFIIGGALWLVALILRLPINSAVSLWLVENMSGASFIYLSIAFPSLTAGIFEEGARWLAFRFAVKDHRLENGLMYGAGHGGVESMLLVGLNVLGTAIIAYFYPQNFTAAQLAVISATPEWTVFLGVWERLAAITFHIAMSILVLQSFREKQAWYLIVAVGAHFFLNFAAVYASQWGLIQSELVVTIFATVSAWYIWTTWKNYKATLTPTPQVPDATVPPATA
jgi:uncharacterized membrane protein YhfC